MYCYFFVLFSFTFGGRIPHPPFVLLFLSIYSRVVSHQKIIFVANKLGSLYLVMFQVKLGMKKYKVDGICFRKQF